jgi:F0F1-type ATP synthase assembly protein I
VADRVYSRLLGDVLSYGWVLPASIAAGAGLGWLLDRWLGLFPVFTIACGLLGFAGGVLQLWREMNALSAATEDPGDAPKDGGPAPP